MADTAVIDHEALARVALGRASSRGGLPVIGRGAAVRLTSSGDELLTALDLEEDLPSTIASLSPTAAASIAARLRGRNQ